MPRSLRTPVRACASFCARRWAAISLLFCVVVTTPVMHANAASITSLTFAKNAINPDNYKENGPRREFDYDITSDYNQPDSFCVRYASVLAVDVAAGGNTESEGVTSSYHINFGVAANPGEPWTIKLWSHRKGECTVIDDNGKQATAEINGPITATCSTGASLAALQFGTYHTDNNNNHPADRHLPINDGPAWALITGVGPVPSITLNFSWGDNVISDPDGSLAGGDEAAVRLGLSTTGVNRVTAGDYEALGDRVKDDDGHFVCAKLCRAPQAVPTAASYCSALDNSTCTFSAAGTVIGCLGNCYTVVCKFYNKNGALVRTATTSITNGSLSWIASSSATGPCTGDPYTMEVSLVDDACNITSESLLAEMAENVEHITIPVAQSAACAGSGGPVNMPSTTVWGRIAVGLTLLLAGAFVITRRRLIRNE